MSIKQNRESRNKPTHIWPIVSAKVQRQIRWEKTVSLTKGGRKLYILMQKITFVLYLAPCTKINSITS